MDVFLRSMLTERQKNKCSVISFSSICFFCYKVLHLSQCLVHRYLRVKGIFSLVLHLKSLVDNFRTIIGKLLFYRAKLTFYRL